MELEGFLALSLVFAQAQASAGNIWLVSEGVNGMTVSSDASTLQCNDGQCSIWEATRYAGPQPNGVLSVRDLAHYDCAGQRTRTEIEVKLDVDGKVLKTLSANRETWIAVQPDTVGAATLAFACNFRAADPTEVRSGRFEVGGRRFVRQEQSDPAGLAPMAAPPTAQTALHGARIAVQIAVSPTEIGAETAAAAFKFKHPSDIAGLEVRIEPAMVKRERVFRVLAEGFAADRDAQAFCLRLKANGADCFVWSSASRATSGRTEERP